MLPDWVKAILAAVSAGMSTVVALHRFNWPSGFWQANPWAKLALVAVLWGGAWGIFEAVDRGVAAKRSRGERRLAAAKVEAEQILKGVLVNVSRTTGLDWTRIGVHLFLVQRQRRRTWPWPVYEEVQKHIVRVKMSQYPPPTGIAWTKGKGVIGLCWSSGGPVAKDVRKALWKHANASPAEWDRVDLIERFGLDYNEFQRSKDTGTVLAAPVLLNMGTTYIGCVSLDAPGDCFNRLNTDEVLERLQAAADFIAPHAANVGRD